MKYKVNDVVKLKSFFGMTEAEEDVNESENYWKLIGTCGKIVEARTKPHPAYLDRGVQYLVQFSDIIEKYNLTIHNPLPYSLLLFESDLEGCLENQKT